MGGWEWVIMFALVVIGIPALIITVVVRNNRKSKQLQQAMWASTFNADTVNYQLAFGAPPYPAVLAEATRRGYRLVGQSPAGMLTFSR